ncbi:hypothetical protein TNCV_4472631 [Trichonephila clavipes]|uniref:Uncharacterized protein n=1 Tax=Trichonephila clavipes TaxID=2585209 RepID=A0A8X6SHH0_TRICX|nr:hypothetical protein TNCV_4472631 [Trichonephila clavipes]
MAHSRCTLYTSGLKFCVCVAGYIFFQYPQSRGIRRPVKPFENERLSSITINWVPTALPESLEQSSNIFFPYHSENKVSPRKTCNSVGSLNIMLTQTITPPFSCCCQVDTHSKSS